MDALQGWYTSRILTFFVILVYQKIILSVPYDNIASCFKNDSTRIHKITGEAIEFFSILLIG